MIGGKDFDSLGGRSDMFGIVLVPGVHVHVTVLEPVSLFLHSSFLFACLPQPACNAVSRVHP